MFYSSVYAENGQLLPSIEFVFTNHKIDDRINMWRGKYKLYWHLCDMLLKCKFLLISNYAIAIWLLYVRVFSK